MQPILLVVTWLDEGSCTGRGESRISGCANLLSIKANAAGVLQSWDLEKQHLAF
jgi:hypothetical protein